MRAGVKSVILPAQNEKKLLEDVPREIRESMTFHLVDSVDQMLNLALEDAPARGTMIREALLRSHN
jgi:ATP-dependent Lon protease